MSKSRALFVSLLLSCSGLALDLTPRQAIVRIEGGAGQRYYFSDGASKLGFHIDARTRLSGGADQLVALFQDLKETDAKMTRSQLTAAVPFDAKGLEQYRALARGLVPESAEGVSVSQENANPISINEWTSYGFSFDYTLFGRPQKTSVTFLNYSPKEQFVIRVSAPAAAHEEAYGRIYRLLNSLYEIPAGDEVKPQGKS